MCSLSWTQSQKLSAASTLWQPPCWAEPGPAQSRVNYRCSAMVTGKPVAFWCVLVPTGRPWPGPRRWQHSTASLGPWLPCRWNMFWQGRGRWLDSGSSGLWSWLNKERQKDTSDEACILSGEKQNLITTKSIKAQGRLHTVIAPSVRWEDAFRYTGEAICPSAKSFNSPLD